MVLRLTRRRCGHLAGALGLLAGSWLVAVDPALADPAPSVEDTGWWSRLNQDPALGGALVYPDVTPGQLLVEATPEGATAIAALRATLPDGAANPVLTLHAASAAGADTAILLACQAGSGWTGVHGGSWDAKPSPDCSRSVQAIPSEDGTEWTFALGPLQLGQQLNVVLTPGRDPASSDALSSPFRVVFDRPGPDAVAVDAAADDGPSPLVPAGGPPAGPGTSAPAPGAPSGPVRVAAPPSFSLAGPPTASDLARQPAQAALPAAEQGATATAPGLAAPALAAAPVGAPTGEGRLLGVLVVLGAAGLLYWSSQQPVPERRLLSRFASAAPVAAAAPAPEPTLGGLGRFRRPRSTPARPLG